MLSSVRDIQILRGNGSGKTTLVSGDLRLAAALIGKEFHLFFFPDGVQRLRRIVAGFIGDFFRHFLAIDLRVSQLEQQLKQRRVAALALLQASAEQAENRRDVLQSAERLRFRQLRQILQVQREMIRQFAAIQLQTVALILRHQVNHRLAAIAGFAVHVLKQQQRGRAAAIEQFAVARLRVQHILSGQVTQENAQLMGILRRALIMAQLKDVTAHAAATVSSWGFVISPEQILQTAKDIGEPSVLNRAGGAPTLAVGIAHVFHKVLPMADMGFWYHFGILFEALFILTALDAGTRSGRFMLQDLLGNFVPFLKKTDSLVAGIIGTAGCVGLWGYLLYQGVVDPLGGVKSLWPLFGISNQMLAAVALVLGTVVLVKMQRTKYIWVTVVPAVWLLICTTWALGLKLFSTNPQMEGFFFMANQYKEKIANGGELTAQQIANMNHIVINNYTNAGLSILFLVVVYSIIFYGFRTWQKARTINGRSDKETPYVPVPEGGVKTSSHH